MISEVATGSPAEAAGLRIGDVVYDIDGRQVRSLNAFHQLISTGGVGNVLEIMAARDGAEIVVEALVDDTPEPAPGAEK
jgi:S1-C subfamily serine protease